jgi:hypothetical protein
MAPLHLSEPGKMPSEAQWRQFANVLREAKSLGAEAVSTDVWWGLIEREDDVFDFSYYDRMADEISKAGLLWVPILSFHACGGNVGDTVNIPLPDWLGAKYEDLDGESGADAVFFKSEYGNVSREAVSPWASAQTLSEFASVMRAFQAHFAARAKDILELNVSLGPTGELRYPSYNPHDPGAAYPTRGALQAYSPLAVESFRDFVLERHGSLEAASAAWGRTLASREDIAPPPEAGAFFEEGQAHEAFGQDFFDWYSDSLLEHGARLLECAVEVFNADGAPFSGIDLGAKIPGVHWRAATDRAAELAAGLLKTSEAEGWESPAKGHGYRDVVGLFRRVEKLPNAPRLVLHFTCLEMDDGDGGPEVGSRAKTLVYRVAAEAKAQGVDIKGENALAHRLSDEAAWENIEEALDKAGYSGVTLLRVTDVVGDPVARRRFKELAKPLDGPATDA